MLDDLLAIPLATLTELARRADEQEHVYQNPVLAAGMRIVIEKTVQELAALGDLLIDPAMAERISGLGPRQLRRILHNYGTRREPKYKLREVRIEGSGRRERAEREAPKQQVSEQRGSATVHTEPCEDKKMDPAAAATAAPPASAIGDSTPAQVPEKHRHSARRDAQIQELARKAALRHRPRTTVSA